MPRGFQYNPPSVVPPGTYPYSENLQVNAGDGELQRVVLEGNIVMLPPLGGSDGNRIEIWLMNATDASVNLSFDDSLAVGEYADADPPLTVDGGSTAILRFSYDEPRNVWTLRGLIDSF